MCGSFWRLLLYPPLLYPPSRQSGRFVGGGTTWNQLVCTLIQNCQTALKLIHWYQCIIDIWPLYFTEVLLHSMIQQIWYIAFHYTQLVRSLETRIQYIQASKYGRPTTLRATTETQVLNIQLSQNLVGVDKQHSDHLQVLILMSMCVCIFVTSRTLKLHMNAYINMCGMEYPLLVCYFINWLAISKTSVEGWFFFFFQLWCIVYLTLLYQTVERRPGYRICVVKFWSQKKNGESSKL